MSEKEHCMKTNKRELLRKIKNFALLRITPAVLHAIKREGSDERLDLGGPLYEQKTD